MIEQKNAVGLETIERLGASGIPMVTALNKIDRLKPEERETKLAAVKDHVRNPILLSAKCQTNLEDLKRHIVRVLENYIQAQFIIPLSGNFMPFISWLHQKTDIHKETYTDSHLEVVFEANPTVVEQVKRKVEELNGTLQTNPPTSK
jgi:GTP-binding protein HflX